MKYKTLDQWKANPEQAQEAYDDLMSGETTDVADYTVYKIEVAL